LGTRYTNTLEFAFTCHIEKNKKDIKMHLIAEYPQQGVFSISCYLIQNKLPSKVVGACCNHFGVRELSGFYILEGHLVVVFRNKIYQYIRVCFDMPY